MKSRLLNAYYFSKKNHCNKSAGSGHIDETNKVGLVNEQSTKTMQTGLCQYAHIGCHYFAAA
jgi:hypothetical protein